jgi:ribosome biogenesis GTPase / thiamine phosphate phosphatase
LTGVDTMKGTIVKGVGGFYFVTDGHDVLRCKARGIFKKDGFMPMVGDEVLVQRNPMGDGTIYEFLPRKNYLVRPPISNIDAVAVVISVADPEPNTYIIDRFLVMAEKNRVEIILCINKIDLNTKMQVENLENIYSSIYPLVEACGLTGRGLPQLKELLRGKKVAFAGPSGVGKSTLINRLNPMIMAPMGEVSSKTGRGKHTTRHVEIFKTDFDAMIFDTPGFTSFNVLEAEPDELQLLYPEMLPFRGQCKYDNCRHLTEPGCRVKQAVEENVIHPSRYASYVEQFREIIEKKKY